LCGFVVQQVVQQVVQHLDMLGCCGCAVVVRFALTTYPQQIEDSGAWAIDRMMMMMMMMNE